MENKTTEVDQISEKLAEEIKKIEELQSNLDAVRFDMKNLEQRNENISQEIFTLCQSLRKDLKTTEFGKSCDHSLLKEDSDSVTDLSKMIDIICSSHTLLKNQTNDLNTTISELSERLKDTEKENETLVVEKSQLEDDVHKVKQKCEMMEMDRNSLVKALENSQHDLELKNSKIQTLEDEISEFQQQVKRLRETVEVKKEENIVLHTKKEVIEKKRVSLEEEVGKLQLKLGNTIIELTTAKTTNETLESKNSQLIFTNARLLDDHASLQNKLNEVEKETNKLLEEKENELLHLKDNLKELDRQKYDLDNEMNNLEELNKQIEKGHEDLQLTSSQIQASNSQLKRDLECERTENLMKITRLQCELEKAFTSLEKQNCKLSQVQNEKDVVHNQLLEAEKELTVLMEDNANLKHQMYQSKTPDKDELLTTRCQV